MGGSLRFISEQAAISSEMKQRAEALAEAGKTPLLFLQEGVFAGIIAVADTIKEDSPKGDR